MPNIILLLMIWTCRIARSRSPGDNSIARDYVLPDFTSIRRGFMKSVEDSTGRPEEGEQLIRMNNERFMVHVRNC